MTISVGVVMDPIQSIAYKKDSTLAMLWAAQKRGWELYYMEQSDLYITGGEARASMRKLQVFHDSTRWFELSSQEDKPLGELQVILMRKDPPFDNEYIYSTYVLEAAENLGTLVVNPAQALRDCNEKITATRFPDCTPPVLVTSNADRIKDFWGEHDDIILKPLDGMGGTSIFRVKKTDPNINVIIETLTNHGQNLTMAQRFIPEIVNGDKRLLLVDGQPQPYALARIPKKGETRGNLAAGGRGVSVEMSERDYEICEKVRPFLQEKGLLFVGLDVIGDYLTEVNVTSPTCIRELDDAHGLDIAGQLMNAIEERLHGK